MKKEKEENPKITEKLLKILCKKNKLYQTPYLNDRLFLHFQGFRKIENLDAYINVKSLWLEGNAISKIENVSHLKDLTCM